MYPSLCVENFFLRNDTYTVLEEFRESTVKQAWLNFRNSSIQRKLTKGGRRKDGVPQVVSYRRILGVFPGSSCSNLDWGSYVAMCACVCGCLWVRTNLPLSSPGVSTLPYALALPSQPSTSPRLVSNDFPPSYPDSGTHPWGTIPLRAVPSTPFHCRHPWFLQAAALTWAEFGWNRTIDRRMGKIFFFLLRLIADFFFQITRKNYSLSSWWYVTSSYISNEDFLWLHAIKGKCKREDGSIILEMHFRVEVVGSQRNIRRREESDF